MNDIRPEDLGSMGESFFNTLCKSIGYVANSSKYDDKGGWDFEVEHRSKNLIDYSNQSYPVYRVQVKSTKGESQTKLTYSNIIKLIQFNGPAFIALLKYADNINPDHVFLFHIDEVFSKKIWREIRKKEISLKKFAINKNEKIIKFGSKQSVLPINGKGLKIAFERHIGSDFLAYVEKKLKFLNKLKKEGKIIQYNWKFRSEKEIQAMAKCFLGYNEKFKIDFSEYNAPFGIRDKNPVSTFKDLRTTISPKYDELKKTKIILKSSKFGKQYEFIGKSYIVPKQLQQFSSKARTECILFDFLIDFDGNSLNITSKDIFNEDIRVTFKELYNYVCFLKDSIKSDETHIKLIDIDSNKTAEVTLSSPHFNLPYDFGMTYNSIGAAYKKFCELNLDSRIISTSYVWRNMGRLHLFYLLGKQFDPNYEIEFENEGVSNPEIDVVIFRSEILIEETILITFAAFFGSVKRVRENTLLGSFYKSELVEDFLLTNHSDIELFTKGKLQEIQKAYFDKGFNVLD